MAELCAAGVGSVLIPFPGAVDDHQRRNAEYLVAAGAALLLLQQDRAFYVYLESVLRDLLSNPMRRLAMAEAARRLAKSDVAECIAEIILKESI